MKVTGRGVVLVAALELAVAGCVGDSAPSASSRSSSHAAAPGSAASGTAAPLEPGPAKAVTPPAAHTRCTSVAGVLDTHLVELGSRLSIGLALDAYSVRVGAAEFSYGELLRRHEWARDDVTDRCRNEVVVPLEAALRAYHAAYGVWSGCVRVPHCTFQEGTAPLEEAQAEWLHAGALVEEAGTALASMQPGA